MSGVSQSAASQCLMELERSLEAELLDRSRRPLKLTEAGRLYLDFCRDVLLRQEELEAGIDRLKEESEGTVRVAAIYSVGLSEMTALEREFARRCPRARLAVEYLRPERVWEAVEAGRAELGLMSYAEGTREMAVLAWREEEMVIVAAPGHRLARREAARPEELDREEFVSFDEDLPIRKHVDRFLRERGVNVREAMHFDNIQSIKDAVEHGLGVSIMPARILRAEQAQGRLALVPIEGGGLMRPLSIVHRKKKRFRRAALEFLKLLEEAPAASGPSGS